MVTSYLSLGSNIEPYYHLSKAISELNHYFGNLKLSPLYESVAVGFNGEHFLNLVASFETDLKPQVIYESLRKIEDNHGRIRNGIRFSQRTLDLDLILYGNLISNEIPILPREEILQYAFVLKPLSDLAPEVIHPINGKSYAELWNNFNYTQQLLWLSKKILT